MGCASPLRPVRATLTGSDAPGRLATCAAFCGFSAPVLHAHFEARDRLGRWCVVGRVPLESGFSS